MYRGTFESSPVLIAREEFQNLKSCVRIDCCRFLQCHIVMGEFKMYRMYHNKQKIIV